MMLPAAIIGGAVSAISDLIDNLHTSDKEKLDAEIELRRIGLQEQIIEAQLIAGQQQTNAAEARHRSLFVAGWRPAIGWIGAVSIGYQFVLYPILIWGWAWMQAQGWVPRELAPPPVLDAEALWVIITGMLGIAGMRSIEKVKGIANR